VKRNIFMLSLLILVTVISFAPVMAQACSCPPVEISKELFCFSDKPPYYVGNKYTWWMKITVTAHTGLSDVIVYDRLGAELMIEGISDSNPYDPIEYNFTYMPYEWNGEVYVNNVLEGNLNKEGVSFDEFHIYWTGKSVKVHFQWNVGPMSSGQTKAIYVIISTDTNPAGWQEYTSCGWYYLNSGATVKAIDAFTGKQYSAVSDRIEIQVICPPS